MAYQANNGAARPHSGGAVPITPLGAPRQRWYDYARADGSHTTRDLPSEDRAYNVKVLVEVEVAVYADEAWDAMDLGKERMAAVADRLCVDGDVRIVGVEDVEAEVSR